MEKNDSLIYKKEVSALCEKIQFNVLHSWNQNYKKKKKMGTKHCTFFQSQSQSDMTHMDTTGILVNLGQLILGTFPQHEQIYQWPDQQNRHLGHQYNLERKDVPSHNSIQ